MLLALLLCSLAAPLPSQAPAPSSAPAGVSGQQPLRPSPPWLTGGLDELLAAAKARSQPALLFFASAEQPQSRALQAALEQLDSGAQAYACLRVEAGAPQQAALLQRFRVHSLPTLVLLDGDGRPRDALAGDLPGPTLRAELTRIARDEGTLGALAREVEAQPDALELRLSYAQRLLGLGDLSGYQTQLAELRRRDPDGRSLALRKVALEAALIEVRVRLDCEPLRRFLAGESAAELLFEGNWYLMSAEEQLARQAEAQQDAVAAMAHRERALAAGRLAWPHAPPERRVSFGNELAWKHYQWRTALAPEELAAALEISTVVCELAPKDAGALDTRACLLHSSGRTAEALELLRRCLELDPSNTLWKQRLQELSR